MVCEVSSCECAESHTALARTFCTYYFVVYPPQQVRQRKESLGPPLSYKVEGHETVHTESVVNTSVFDHPPLTAGMSVVMALPKLHYHPIVSFVYYTTLCGKVSLFCLSQLAFKKLDCGRW